MLGAAAGSRGLELRGTVKLKKTDDVSPRKSVTTTQHDQ